jgi:hypothetical protein
MSSVHVIGVEHLLAGIDEGAIVQPTVEARAVPGVARRIADLLDVEE